MPILKWKKAEQDALKYLNNDQKSKIIPIIELLPDKIETEGADIKKFTENILKIWCFDGCPMYIDFTQLIQQKTVSDILMYCRELSLNIIPVANLAGSVDRLRSIALTDNAQEKGVCLRIVPAELLDAEALNGKLASFVSDYNMERKRIDILLDFKEQTDREDYIGGVTAIRQIDGVASYRKLIVAGGSFPVDLSEFSNDEVGIVPRKEWINWNAVRTHSSGLQIPLFADYTVVHPLIRESIPIPPSISIRYTNRDTWFIHRGVKTKKHQYGHGQYLSHASTIVQTPDEFYGATFSYGDNYIAEKAAYLGEYIKQKDAGKDPKGTGGTKEWLTVSINHHIAVTIDQIANLDE